MTRLRVVQWATGNIGTWSLRAVIDHPDLDLAGVWVHSEDKAGKDAGGLCGIGPVGVTATTSLDDILAIGADCVLYMPRACDVDEVCAILASGANIVTTRGEFQRPASVAPGVRERVDAACAAGGTSIHSTGSSPGFISEAVPLVLSSIQRRLDSLVIDEFADLSGRPSPDLLFNIMGFGQEPAEFDAGRVAHLQGAFGPSLELVADALGITLDGVEGSGELALAKNTVEIAAGTVQAGTVGGQRVTVAGMRGGEPVLKFRANWFCTSDIDADWDLLPTGWRVTVEGDAPMQVDIQLTAPLDGMAGYTANRAVNAVVPVCAAEPGMRSILDLPPILPSFG